MGQYGIAIILAILPIVGVANPSCKENEHWVGSHNRRAYTRYDGVYVSATQVKGHCRKSPRGYKKWNHRLTNKQPKIWGYTKERSKKWTTEEVERFHEALSVLPDKLLNLENIKIFRMGKSMTNGNPATSNYEDITLYNLAFQHKNSLAQILAHELSHSMYRQLSEPEKIAFSEVAGWVEHPKIKGMD